jgi:hypothetical protein
MLGSAKESDMIEQRHLDLLSELSTDESAHSGDSLSRHLKGTHDLLAKWDNPNDVCVAGLFHSIYGTQYYKVQSASFSDRERIADVIGPASEELAFVFCTTDRLGFFSEAGQVSPMLTNATSNKSVPVSVETLSALIEIEVANFVEQFRPDNASVKPAEFPKLIQFMSYMLHKAGDQHLTKKARDALAAQLEPYKELCSAGSMTLG